MYPSRWSKYVGASVLGLAAAAVWVTGVAHRTAVIDWPDRRPLGMLHMASVAHRSKLNPRGWFNNPSLDVRTAAFRARALAYADQSIRVIKENGGQGMVVWDLEGQEYDHKISFIGDPRIAETLAPEWRGVIDEFFARFRAAGLRLGLTIRPQQFENGRQRDVWNPSTLLNEKIAYAKRRWGVTVFYVDTNRWGYLILPAPILRRVERAHPDVLLLPEHEWPGYYAFSAPLRNLRKEPARPPWLASLYHRGFNVIFISDGDPANRLAELKAATRAGDILMFRGWFPDRGNAVVRAAAP